MGHPSTINHVILLPSRPTFQWDVESPPWTDARGGQFDNKYQFNSWDHFHDSLPNKNRNEIPENWHCIFLESQLFGRVVDLCFGISSTEITSEAEVSKFVNAIYQRHGLVVFSEWGLHAIERSIRDQKRTSESMKAFEVRFAGSVAKFNAISASTKLPNCLTALMLLSNSHITDAQRASVLAAAASRSNIENVSTATNEQFLQFISYCALGPVFKQCEGNRIGDDNALNRNNGHATHSRFNGNGNFKHGNQLTKEH